MSRPRATKKAKSLLVAESDAMRVVADAIEELADGNGPVLVLGEHGVGREMVARILHFSSSRRAGEFVTVRAGSAPKLLFADAPDAASEATLSAASGGTLLIKDLCELPRLGQRRLLKVVAPGAARRRSSKSRRYDVRVIGSSDMDLDVVAEAGVFLERLYECFDARKIEVPPLRERIADIPPLAALLIRTYGREVGRNRMTLSTRAYERLVKYPWPGNVAELKGIARRLVFRAKKSRIEAGDVDAVLPTVAERVPLEEMSFEEMVQSKLTTFLRRIDGYPLTGLYEDVMNRVERPLIELVMKSTGGNQLRAAEILGVNRNTLRRKLGEHGLRARLKSKTTMSASGASKSPASRRRS